METVSSGIGGKLLHDIISTGLCGQCRCNPAEMRRSGRGFSLDAKGSIQFPDVRNRNNPDEDILKESPLIPQPVGQGG